MFSRRLRSPWSPGESAELVNSMGMVEQHRSAVAKDNIPSRIRRSAICKPSTMLKDHVEKESEVDEECCRRQVPDNDGRF